MLARPLHANDIATSAGFSLPDIACVLRLNVAIDNGSEVRLGPTAKLSNNSWQEGDSAAALFRSRRGDGRRPPCR